MAAYEEDFEVSPAIEIDFAIVTEVFEATFDFSPAVEIDFVLLPPPPPPPPLPVTQSDALLLLMGGPFTMQPAQHTIDRLAAALAADTGSFADAGNRQVGLFMTDITPSLSLVIADIVEPTFTGYARLNGGTTTVQVDPGTGEKLLRVPDPAGGWKFIPTDGVNLPQTIYGWFLYAQTTNKLLGAERFPTPITLTAAAQVIDIPGVYARVDVGALS